MSAYDKAHKWAKLLVMTIVILLILLGDSRYLDALAVIIWFWGVNPVAYCVEHFLNFKHKHKIW